MTELMAWVDDARDAEAAAAAGFDGVLVPTSPTAASVASAVGERLVVGVPGSGADALLMTLRAPSSARPRTLHLFRDRMPDAAALDAAKADGRDGILLAPAARLLDVFGPSDLSGLLAACRTRGLLGGMSGALEPPDIPRLMALQPDLVVVGPAFGQAPGARPDAAAWHLFRDLVPRREPARPVASGAGRDRIFVRDFVLSMSIGAYAAERDKPHRVRFSVEAEIAGLGRPSRDMRDVVSYDLITDSIRDVAASGHVAFVETIAEQIAERLLAHPRVETVRITVEKLDLGSHSVGVEIRRETAR